MRTKVVSDFSELVSALAERCQGTHMPVILIDGFPGSGKSTLARQLADALQAIHIEVDKFLLKDQGGYVEYLQYDTLASAVRSALERPVIIEGVCTGAVSQRIGIDVTVSVYVKRMTANSVWDDGTDLEAGSAEDAIVNAEAERRKLSEAWGEPVPAGSLLHPLNIECLKYHYRFLPHERSTFTYIREEED